MAMQLVNGKLGFKLRTLDPKTCPCTRGNHLSICALTLGEFQHEIILTWGLLKSNHFIKTSLPMFPLHRIFFKFFYFFLSQFEKLVLNIFPENSLSYGDLQTCQSTIVPCIVTILNHIIALFPFSCIQFSSFEQKMFSSAASILQQTVQYEVHTHAQSYFKMLVTEETAWLEKKSKYIFERELFW